MARTLNAEDHAARRNQILDAAQRLVQTKGYAQMTIQDVLDALQISKGAFYHYFGSKPALLEALIERLQLQAEAVITPILQDERLPALEKLQRYFAAANLWKAGQKAYLLGLLRIWYHDDNAVVRQKMIESMIRQFTPQLDGLIQQGVREGVMQPAYPDQAGALVMSMIQSMGEMVARSVLADELNHRTLAAVMEGVAAYTDALERILGIRPGSLHLIDAAMLEEWITPGN